MGWRLQAPSNAFAHGFAINPELAGDRLNRQPLAMQIKNHDDFPKFDHRSAPSFWAERDGVSDTINWGIFNRHFWDAGKLHVQSFNA
jgi:hypothetical protein